ncbi:MAG: AAA family ATPase [Deltaproteobacteria bacterium]|nr:AAA family ATPase [Deltaproteobacteria bacterium]
MYIEFFGLAEKPFNITADPNYLFESSIHEPALDSLLYGIESKAGIMVLTGPVGTGKTTLCRSILEKLSNTTNTCFLMNPIFDPIDVLKAINQDFGLANQGSLKELMDVLNQFLLESMEAGLNNLIIVDEAQNLSIESLETLRLLSNLETTKHKVLQILLVGQPELVEKLASPRLLQLNQRVVIRVSLSALTESDSNHYILHRLAKANGLGKVLFDEKTLKSIFKYSHGFPRMINLLCDRILLALYAKGLRQVNKKIVKAAYQELKANNIQRPFWKRRLSSVYH